MEGLFKQSFPCLPPALLDAKLDINAVTALSIAVRDAIGAHNGSHMLRCIQTARRFDTHIRTARSRAAVLTLLLELALLQLLERMSSRSYVPVRLIGASEGHHRGNDTVTVTGCRVLIGKSKSKKYEADSVVSIFNSNVMLHLGRRIDDKGETEFRMLLGLLLFAPLISRDKWPEAFGKPGKRVWGSLRKSSPASELARGLVCDLQSLRKDVSNETAAVLVVDMLIASVACTLHLPCAQTAAFVGTKRTYGFFTFSPRPVAEGGPARDADVMKRLEAFLQKFPADLCHVKPAPAETLDYLLFKSHALKSYKKRIIEIRARSSGEPQTGTLSDLHNPDAPFDDDGDAVHPSKRPRLDPGRVKGRFLINDADWGIDVLVNRISYLTPVKLRFYVMELMPRVPLDSTSDDVLRLKLRLGACVMRASPGLENSLQLPCPRRSGLLARELSRRCLRVALCSWRRRGCGACAGPHHGRRS